MLSDELKRDLILSIGTHHRKRPLTPVEVAEGIDAAKKSGMSLKEIGDMVLLHDSSMLGRFTSLLNLKPEIKSLVDWGQSGATISFSSATEISNLALSDQEAIASAVLEYRLTKNDVIQISQINKRSGRDINDCIKEVLSMRPQIVRKHVFIGAITEESLLERLAESKQADRDEMLKRVIESRFRFETGWSGRLGKKEFSLVGDEELSGQLKRLEPSFEHVINHWLMEEMQNEE